MRPCKNIKKFYFTYLGHPFSSPGAIAVVSLYIFGLSCSLFFLRQTVQNISFLSIQNDRESNFLLQVAHFIHFLWYFTPPMEINISINLYEFANILNQGKCQTFRAIELPAGNPSASYTTFSHLAQCSASNPAVILIY